MKVAIADGLWSDLNTWGNVPNTPTIHASTNLTLTTGNTFTATWTAPNTTNTVIGMVMYLHTVATGSVVVTLQESAVDTAATVTVNMNTIGANDTRTKVFFRFATPYTYTTTAAGAYRFRVTMTGISGTTSFAADSGGTLLSFAAVDNNSAVPGTTEDVIIPGYNGVTTQTVTMDGTITSGSGTTTTLLANTASRAWGLAIEVAEDGILEADTSANVTVTTRGHIVVSGNGQWNIGDSTTDYPMVYSHILDQNGTSGNYGVRFNTNTTRNFYGPLKDFHATTYVSGVGTVIDPLITSDAVNWAVGDRIVIAGSVYNQYETRYIITVNSSTSYVLSATSGGAAAAFTNTHVAGQPIVNTWYNIRFSTNNTSQAFYWQDASTVGAGTATPGLVTRGVTFDTTGTTAGNKNGIYPQFEAGTDSLYEYCAAYGPVSYGFSFILSAITRTYTGLVGAAGISAGGSSQRLFNVIQANNKTFVDCYAIGTQAWCLSIASCVNTTWDNSYFWNGNNVGTTTQSGILIDRANINTFTDCSVNGNRIAGITMTATSGVVGLNTYGTVFVRGNIGVAATNTTDLQPTADGFVSFLFTDCDFGSATLISNYTLLASGSIVAFDTFNSTQNDHRWYTPQGIFRSTGASLGDTTVRTSGTLNLRIAPESATGAFWDFYVLSRVSQAAIATGYIYCNAAFLADASASVTVSLFLPGSLVADQTVTMTKTTNSASNDAFFNLGRLFTGTVPLYSRIRITAITVTANAYVYVADIFGGTNPITNLTTWHNGQPSPIMFEQLGDNQGVWQVPTSALTTAGTTGRKLNDDLTTNEFIALK